MGHWPAAGSPWLAEHGGQHLLFAISTAGAVEKRRAAVAITPLLSFVRIDGAKRLPSWQPRFYISELHLPWPR